MLIILSINIIKILLNTFFPFHLLAFQLYFPVLLLWFSSVQLLSRVRLCNPTNCNMPGLPVHHQLPESTQTQVHWVDDAIQPSHPLSFPSPPSPKSLPASGSFQMSQLFTSGSQSVKSFSFSISPSKEHPGLISFRMDWLDLLALLGTLKSLLQHHSSKASIFLCSAFFIVQLSHPYRTTGKTIALTEMDLCWQSNVSAF